MKKIILHGDLANKFGRIWNLNVSSFSECIRGIEANRPGFYNFIVNQARKGIHYCFKSEDGRIVEKEELHMSAGVDKMHIYPLAYGGGGFISLGGMAMSFGMGFLSNYIGGKIMDKLRPKQISDPDRLSTNSYSFNGPENVITQGGAVPVGYGELLVGSNVISEAQINYDFDSKKGEIANFSYPLDRFRGDNSFLINTAASGVEKGQDQPWSVKNLGQGMFTNALNAVVNEKVLRGVAPYDGTFGTNISTEEVNELLGEDAECVVQWIDGNSYSIYNETGSAGFNSAKVGPRFVASDGITPLSYAKAMKTEDKQLGYKKLESTAIYKVLDLICEGPIEGFVDEAGNVDNFDVLLKNSAPVICGNVEQNATFATIFDCVAEDDSNYNKLFHLAQIQPVGGELTTGINIVDSGFGFEEGKKVNFSIQAPSGKEDPIVSGETSFYKTWETPPWPAFFGFNLSGEINHNIVSGGLGQIQPISGVIPYPYKYPAITNEPLWGHLFNDMQDLMPRVGDGDPSNGRPGDVDNYEFSRARAPAFPIISKDISSFASSEAGGLFQESKEKPEVGSSRFSFYDLRNFLSRIVDNLYVTDATAAPVTTENPAGLPQAADTDIKFKDEIINSNYLSRSLDGVGNTKFNLDQVCVWPFNSYRDFSMLSINGEKKLVGKSAGELTELSGIKIFYNIWASVLGLRSSADGRPGTVPARKYEDLGKFWGKRDFGVNGPITLDPNYTVGAEYQSDYFGDASSLGNLTPSDSIAISPGRLVSNLNKRIYYRNKDVQTPALPQFLDEKIDLGNTNALSTTAISAMERVLNPENMGSAYSAKITNPLVMIHQIVGCLLLIGNENLWEHGFSPTYNPLHFYTINGSADGWGGWIFWPWYVFSWNKALKAPCLRAWNMVPNDPVEKRTAVFKRDLPREDPKEGGLTSTITANIWQLVPNPDAEWSFLKFNQRFSMPSAIRYRKRVTQGNAIRQGFDFSNNVFPRIRIGQNFGKPNEAYYDVDLAEFRGLNLSDNEAAAELIETDESCIISSMGFPTTGAWANGVDATVGVFNELDPIRLKVEKPWIGIDYEKLDIPNQVPEPGSVQEQLGLDSKILIQGSQINVGYNALQLMEYYDTVTAVPDNTANALVFNNSVQSTYVLGGYVTPTPDPIARVINAPMGDGALEDQFIYSAFNKEITFTPKYYLENPDKIPPYYQPAAAFATIKSGRLNQVFLQDAGFGYPDVDLGEDPTVYLTFPHPNPAWIINSGRKTSKGEFSSRLDLSKTGTTSDNYENHLILRAGELTGDYESRAEIESFQLNNAGAVTDIEYASRGRGYCNYFVSQQDAWDLTLSSYKKPKFNFGIEKSRLSGITLTENASGYNQSDFPLEFKVIKPYSTPADSNAWAKSIYLDDIPVKNTKTNDFNFTSFDFEATKKVLSDGVEMGSNLNSPLPTGFQYSFRTFNYDKELFGPREGTRVGFQSSFKALGEPDVGAVKVDEVKGDANYDVGFAEYPLRHVVDDELVSYIYVSVDIQSLLYLYEGDKEKTVMDLTKPFMGIIAYVILEPMMMKFIEDIFLPPDSTSALGFSSPTGGPVFSINAQDGWTIGKALKALVNAAVVLTVGTAAFMAGWLLADFLDLSFEWLRINMGEKIKNSGETRPSYLQLEISYYNEGAISAGAAEDYMKKYSSKIDFKGVVVGSSYTKDIKILLPPNPNKRRRIVEVARLSRERDYVRGGEKESRFEEKASLKCITEIKPVNLNYSNSVVFASSINAEEFRSIPKREYNLRLKKVRVPTNYNGTARTYGSSCWEGGFKSELEWTNNPAWCFYDLITNSRFGLGRFGVEDTYANKWNLYEIAKYCDELVYTGISNRYPFRNFTFSELDEESGVIVFTIEVGQDEIFSKEFGFGGEQSPGEVSIMSLDNSFMSRGVVFLSNGINEIRVKIDSTRFRERYDALPVGQIFKVVREFDGKIIEPRFSFNAYIKDRQDALKLINDITNLFNSIIYWSQGEIYLSADRPKDPVMLFNNSNVSPEGFSYSSTRKDQRYTTCKVRYNDAADRYKPKVEYIESSEGIQKFGIIENSIAPMGLTSKTEAQRAARYLLTSSLNETEIVEFSTSLEASYLRPGDIIKVLDNNRINQRLAGMIVGVNESEGVVDLDFPLDCIVDSSEPESYLKFNTYSPSGNILDNDSVVNSCKVGLFHPTQIVELYITGLSADKNSIFLSEYDGASYSSDTSTFEKTMSNMDVGYAWAASNTNEGTEGDFNLYRVITLTEENDNNYSINAIEHIPSKFNYIDRENEKALVTKSLGPYIDIAAPTTPTKKPLGDASAPPAVGGISFDPVAANRGRGQSDYIRVMRGSTGDDESPFYSWYLLFNWVPPTIEPNGYFYKLYIDNQLVESDYLRSGGSAGYQFNLKDYGEAHPTILDVAGVESDQSEFSKVIISSKINLLVYSYSGDPDADNVSVSKDYINLEFKPELDFYYIVNSLSGDGGRGNLVADINAIQESLPGGGSVVVDTDYLGKLGVYQVLDPWVRSPQLYFFYPEENDSESTSASNSWIYINPSSFPNSELSGWTFLMSSVDVKKPDYTLEGWIWRFGSNPNPYDESERFVFASVENGSGVLTVRDANLGPQAPVYYDLHAL
jgi:predicted phage tail protein